MVERQTDFAASGARRRRVLVVDDSKLQRRILAASLGRWGYEVIEAESAAQALLLCDVQLPDIILSDWMMPGMDGIEFCQALRAKQSGFAYFILLTSKSDTADVAAGLDAGADDFLSKPVDTDELRARLTAGERIIDMQRELLETNRLMRHTLEELQLLYDSLDKDLQEARDLQQSLVRERYRNFGAADVSVLLRASGHVGGDLVGFFEINAHQVGLFGVDVSGHGISSALMTARLAGYLSSSSPEQNIALERLDDGTLSARNPADAILELNHLVLEEMETEHYFTMMLGIADLRTGRVTLSQAGHPHPVVQRRNGTISQNGTGGYPVGLIEGARFESFEIQLAPGDRLMMLSDGFTECHDTEGQLLGEEGLEDLITGLANVRGSAFLEALVWQLADFAGTSEFSDDVSGLVIDYHGRAEP